MGFENNKEKSSLKNLENYNINKDKIKWRASPNLGYFCSISISSIIASVQTDRKENLGEILKTIKNVTVLHHLASEKNRQDYTPAQVNILSSLFLCISSYDDKSPKCVSLYLLAVTKILGNKYTIRRKKWNFMGYIILSNRTASSASFSR